MRVGSGEGSLLFGPGRCAYGLESGTVLEGVKESGECGRGQGAHCWGREGVHMGWRAQGPEERA